ncbi:MAG: hypothetical protein H2172_05150 [Opitutus sp.]|nr:hypothetical protein [Opitutus sp.]MCS6247854.1 hypothetical protein [Opitutus sp.]MCS6274165.1 hypothetical protein [Opitutus sp.]MCS6278939.1 hypothetical protein [Opitutus sp.]MCS6298689.1 hypothetical protein [Opitutus sp.]
MQLLPDPQFNVNATGSCTVAQPWGGLRSALVGLFILVCLVLPRLIWQPQVQTVEPEVLALDAWLEFFDPEFAVLQFDAAPPLDVRLGLVRPWPDEAEADVDVQLALWGTRVWSWLPAEVERGYWMEGRFSPAWRKTDAEQFNYKVTPSFNFEQKGLRPSGVVIRLWINF